MMTGRDLILYILSNGLEDKPVFDNDTFIGFETEGAFAERMGVGVATVRAWINMGVLDCICVGNKVYFPFNHIFYIL